MNQSVYVIAAEGGPVKVGIALNPWHRLVQLQSGIEERLTLAFAGRVEGRAKALEAETHRILAPHHHWGEWFKTSVDVAVDAIDVAATYLGHKVAAMDVSKRRYGHVMQLVIPDEMCMQIDDFRRDLRPIPNRSEAIRLLVEQAFSKR
jgi:hypothetical protein